MRLLLLISFVLLGGFDLAYSDQPTFGDITLQIDNQPEIKLSIQRALLYREVDVIYDTTVQVQDSLTPRVFYYPQLFKGTHNVLRLIAFPQNKSSNDFFDIFFNLGDSLQPELDIPDEPGNISVNYNGVLWTYIPAARNIRSHFSIIENPKDASVTGQFDAELEFPAFARDSTYHHIKMTGIFDVPAGKFQEISIASVAPIQEQKARYKRNLYIALLITAIIVITFGIR